MLVKKVRKRTWEGSQRMKASSRKRKGSWRKTDHAGET
jgi:hypothetical protein